MELVTLFACLDVCHGTLKFKEEFFTRTGSHRIPRDYVTFAFLTTRKFVVWMKCVANMSMNFCCCRRNMEVGRASYLMLPAFYLVKFCSKFRLLHHFGFLVSSWFPCVYKQMLHWFPRFQVATTCFSCSPPDLNLVVTNIIFCMHVK